MKKSYSLLLFVMMAFLTSFMAKADITIKVNMANVVQFDESYLNEGENIIKAGEDGYVIGELRANVGYDMKVVNETRGSDIPVDIYDGQKKQIFILDALQQETL